MQHCVAFWAPRMETDGPRNAGATSVHSCGVATLRFEHEAARCQEYRFSIVSQGRPPRVRVSRVTVPVYYRPPVRVEPDPVCQTKTPA